MVVGNGLEKQFAEVSYDVEFSLTELALNVGFRGFIGLKERDARLDTYFCDAPAVRPRNISLN